MGEQFELVKSEECVVVRVENDLVSYLRTQGYSDRAIAEICRWYVSSTTKVSSGNLPSELKN